MFFLKQKICFFFSPQLLLDYSEFGGLRGPDPSDLLVSRLFPAVYLICYVTGRDCARQQTAGITLLCFLFSLTFQIFLCRLK